MTQIRYLVVKLKPGRYPFNNVETISVSVVAHGVVIRANESYHKQDDFEALFPHLMEHAKHTILEQVKKLDAVGWDKQKIRDMEV